MTEPRMISIKDTVGRRLLPRIEENLVTPDELVFA